MSRPTVAFALLVLLAAQAVPAESPEPASARLTWFAPDGQPRWSFDLTEDGGEVRDLLTSTPWYLPLPDLEVRLFGGEVFPLRDARGSVVVLDFWATWCLPCREELPRFQALHEQYEETGLKALAINVSESPALVLPYAEDMGLTMPIGIYQEAMTPTLYGNSLPVIVVADRQGRIRGRWDGYEKGFEEEIETLIVRLLETQAEKKREVARVLEGHGRLRVDWMRGMPGGIDDVDVISRPAEGPGILVSHGRLMALYAPNGRTDEQWAGDRAMGRVRLDPTSDDLPFRLAGFRPGGKQISLMTAPGGERSTIDLDSYVFDVEWLPVSWSDGSPRLVAGTLEGIRLLDGNGRLAESPEGFGAISAMKPVVDGATQYLLVMESTGRLSWVDESFGRVRQADTDPEAWVLATTDRSADGVGVGSGTAIAAVSGQFMEGEGAQVAVATETGRLVVLRISDGQRLFEAEWEGLARLAAGDLNGDGLDELVVAQGKQLAVLTALAKSTR